MVIYDWKARRAGGRITVYGKDEAGKDAKIVGVDVIQPKGSGIYATDKAGNDHTLVLGS